MIVNRAPHCRNRNSRRKTASVWQVASLIRGMGKVVLFEIDGIWPGRNLVNIVCI